MVAIIGTLTAIFAATIGIAQTDIKKVLAYSTVSQLGYMFMACGVGAYSAGIFHLMTHAFFKGLLVPGRRISDSRGGRRAGHAADGRTAEVHPVDVLDDDGCHVCDRRHSAVCWLLQQGRNSVAGVSGGSWVYWLIGLIHCLPHVVLYVPALVHDVLWRVSRATRRHRTETYDMPMATGMALHTRVRW